MCALIVLLWQALSPRKAKSPPAQHGAAHASARDDASEAQPSGSEDDGRSEAASSDAIPSAPPLVHSPARLLVEVLRRDDATPVAGVEVRIYRPGGVLAERTDAVGRARFEFEHATTTRLLSVSASADTAARELSKEVHCPAGGERVERLEVTGGATLSGTVVDLEQRPVANAEVLAWCRSGYPYETPPDRVVHCDASGAFTLSHLGDRFYAAARAEGLCCSRGLSGVIADGTAGEGLEIVLAPCTTIRGHVVDDAGTPLGGATIRMEGASSSSQLDATLVPGVQRCAWGGALLASEPDGSFQIDGLPGGRSYGFNVWFEHATCIGDYARLHSNLDDNRVVLKRGVEATGFVYRHDGEPAVGAAVRIGHTSGRTRKVVTESDGSFRAQGLPPDERSIVSVVSPGQAIQVVQPVEIAAGAKPIVVRLARGRPLGGFVRDASGAPVAGASIAIEGDELVEFEGVSFAERTTWEWYCDRNKTHTDAEGRFLFEDLYDGTFEMRIRAPADPDLALALSARSGSDDLDIRLDPREMQRSVLTGRVVDAANGTPIGAFSVLVMRPDDDGGWSGRTRAIESATGEFRLAGLDPGEVRVTITATGYASWKSDELNLELGETSLDTRLFAARMLQLRVVDANGPLNSTCRLAFEDPGGRRLDVELPSGGRTDSLSANIGPGIVQGLPAAPFTVVAHYLGEEFRFDFDLTRPLEGVQELVLRSGTPRPIDWLFLDGPQPSDRDGNTATIPLGPERFPGFRIEVEFKTASGARVGGASCAPKDGEYEVEVSVFGRGSLGSRLVPELECELPASVTRATIRAEGRRDLVVELAEEPAKADGPRAIWLEKP